MPDHENFSLESQAPEEESMTSVQKNDEVNISEIRKSLPSICKCNMEECFSLQRIMESLNQHLDIESVWSLLHQILLLLRSFISDKCAFEAFEVPKRMCNIHLHRDGMIHWQWSDDELREIFQNPVTCVTEKECLEMIGCLVYSALNHTLPEDMENILPDQLGKVFELLCFGTIDSTKLFDECVSSSTPMLDYALEKCRKRIIFTFPGNYYKFYCSTLFQEAFPLVQRNRSVSSSEGTSKEVAGPNCSDKIKINMLDTFNDTNWGTTFNKVVEELKSYQFKNTSSIAE